MKKLLALLLVLALLHELAHFNRGDHTNEEYQEYL